MVRFRATGVTKAVGKRAAIEHEAIQQQLHDQGSVEKTEFDDDPWGSADILKAPPLCRGLVDFGGPRRCRRFYGLFFLLLLLPFVGFAATQFLFVPLDAELQGSEFQENAGKGNEQIEAQAQPRPPAVGPLKGRVPVPEVFSIRCGKARGFGPVVDNVVIPLAGVAIVPLAHPEKSHQGHGLEGLGRRRWRFLPWIGVATATATAVQILRTVLGRDGDALDFFFSVVADIPKGMIPVFLVSPSSLRQEHVFVLFLGDQKGDAVNVRPVVFRWQDGPGEARTKGGFAVRKHARDVREDVSRNLADLVVQTLDLAAFFKDGRVHVGPVRKVPDEFFVFFVVIGVDMSALCCCCCGLGGSHHGVDGGGAPIRALAVFVRMASAAAVATVALHVFRNPVTQLNGHGGGSASTIRHNLLALFRGRRIGFWVSFLCCACCVENHELSVDNGFTEFRKDPGCSRKKVYVEEQTWCSSDSWCSSECPSAMMVLSDRKRTVERAFWDSELHCRVCYVESDTSVWLYSNSIAEGRIQLYCTVGRTNE